MKHLYRAGMLAALALALILASAPPVGAQTNVQRDTPLGGAVGAADSDVALLIKRIDGTPGYVTVSAAGDILLEQGDTSTADTNIECDASIATDGSRNGTLDVSVAACDTLQEVCDIINSQGDNEWACVILDGLSTDTPGPAGTGFILAVTDADASRSVTGGYGIKWDTSAAWTATVALVPPELRLIESYYTVNNDGTKTFHQNPYLANPVQPYFISAHATTTYGSGTSTFSIQSQKPGAPSGTYTYATSQGSMGTARVLYSEAAGATTAKKDFDFAESLRNGFPLLYGQKAIARVTNSEAMTAVVMAAVGQGIR